MFCTDCDGTNCSRQEMKRTDKTKNITGMHNLRDESF